MPLRHDALRTGEIVIDRAALNHLSESANAHFNFALFSDVQIDGVVQSIDARSPQSFTCTGSLRDPQHEDPRGWFVISAEDDAVVAIFCDEQRGTFEVRSRAASSLCTVTQINAAELGGCAASPQLNHDASQNNSADAAHFSIPDNQQNTPACDDSIDVLVVYTPFAMQMAGGEAIIRALAYSSVAVGNLALANSQLPIRLRVVHIAQTNYAESSSTATDLDRLTQGNDGYMDEVGFLRTQYGADLVTLLVHSFDNNCGVAYTMQGALPSFQNLAFSVVQQNCAVANLSMVHELAHNLGCQHDWSDPSTGAFPYSHGYRFVGNSGQQWRTMMATGSGIRIPFFSTPDILWDGVPIGVPARQPSPADNARTIASTAAVVSQFRARNLIDCNHNGISDACDITSGFSLDLNQNGVPDECDAPACAAHDLTRIIAPDAASFDRFGNAVAMSDDRIVVGAALDDAAAVDSGSAYVYRNANDRWNLEAKLTAPDGYAFQAFGQSVAISPGGTYILIGAYRDLAQFSDAGAVYIFHHDGAKWVQQAKITNPDPQMADDFGWSVAWIGSEFPRDQTTQSESNLCALIGTPFDDEGASDSGAAYLVRLTSTGWSTPIKIKAGDIEQGARFGIAVRGSIEGSRFIVGASNADAAGTNGGASNAGAAYVFRLERDACVQEAKLQANSPLAEARLGWSVAIDGSTALCGAITDSFFGEKAGAAIVFQRSDAGQWSQQAKLFASNPAAGKQFGAAVALRNGNALVGSILDEVAGAACGSAYLFKHLGDQWLQRARLAPHDAAPFDNFANALAIAPDGSRAVAGALFDDAQAAIDSGAAFVIPLDLDELDCNHNGIADACDIASGFSADANHNGIPDECEPRPCPADVAGNDGVVNVRDLLAVIDQWGACPQPCAFASCPADITNDCQVNVQDLIEVILHWGACR